MDYKGNLWSAILALIIGIAMIFFSNTALHTVVVVVGILFIAIAVFNFAFEFSRKRKASGGTSMTAILSSAGAGVLGILMVFTPTSMVDLMVYLFAAAIILLGLFQIINLAFAYRPVTFPFWFFILPALLVITGVVICIIGAHAVGELMILITGIALVVYSVATFVDIAGLLSFRRDLAKAQKAADEAARQAEKPAVEDVQATEIK
ncbi:MAG: DUF308 domain-containing protein [Bacteroides sp.]|nr:DUF308 domain-containing protein [Bacteroides sp.]MCM1379859.1 DUF308 domain-containing protein [Bacteroides sp.]MCM1446109.1 DUF308 domain-containing protein [Prevotella sp.]